MKVYKLLTIACLIIVAMTACGGNEKENNEPKPDPIGNTTNNHQTTDIPDTNGQIVEMDAKTFKTYIWNYDKSPSKVLYNGDKPALIEFYTQTCNICKEIKKSLLDLAKQYKGASYFFSVDAEKEGMNGNNNDIVKALMRIRNMQEAYPIMLLVAPNNEEVKVLQGYGECSTIPKKFLLKYAM